MALGFGVFLATAVYLVVMANLYHAGYSPSELVLQWVGSARNARYVLLGHRGFATLTFALYFLQVVSGVLRKPLHRRVYKLFLPMWMISYLTGLIVFV